MLRMLKADVTAFLSDVGYAVRVALRSLKHLFDLLFSLNLQQTVANVLLLVLFCFLLAFTFILCNHCGIISLVRDIVRRLLVIAVVIVRGTIRGFLLFCQLFFILARDLLGVLNSSTQRVQLIMLVVLEKCCNAILDVVFFLYLLSSVAYQHVSSRISLPSTVKRMSKVVFAIAVLLLRKIVLLLRLRQIAMVAKDLIFSITYFFLNALTRHMNRVRTRARQEREIINHEPLPRRPSAADRNAFYLEQRMNREVHSMDVGQLDDYLMARVNMDRHNNMYYRYIIRENELGEWQISVQSLPRNENFIHNRLNRVRGMMGLQRKLAPMGRRIVWQVNTTDVRHGIACEVSNVALKSRKKKKSERELDGGDLPECVVCQDRSRSVVLMPCRHLCLCTQCCSAILASTRLCPVCRQEINASTEVFV